MSRAILADCLSPSFHVHPSTASTVARARDGLCRLRPARSTVYRELALSLASLRATVAAGAAPLDIR